MNFIAEENRIYLNDENGELVAEVLFPALSDTTVDITRTFVDESLRGQGVAGKLMGAAARQLRAQGKKAVLTCPYAIKWFEKNSDFSDILSGADISTIK